MALSEKKINSDKLLEMPPSDETTFPELAYIQVFEHARSLIITDGP